MSDRSMGVLQQADEERKRRMENPDPFRCQHCYCINIGMTTGRTVPHMRCCKCGDERAYGVTW